MLVGVEGAVQHYAPPACANNSKTACQIGSECSLHGHFLILHHSLASPLRQHDGHSLERPLSREELRAAGLQALDPSAAESVEEPTEAPLAVEPGETSAISDDLLNSMRCSITGAIMHRPVLVAASGLSYEHSALLTWLETSKTDPSTRAAVNPLVLGAIVENRGMRAMIEALAAMYPAVAAEYAESQTDHPAPEQPAARAAAHVPVPQPAPAGGRRDDRLTTTTTTNNNNNYGLSASMADLLARHARNLQHQEAARQRMLESRRAYEEAANGRGSWIMP